MDKRKLGDYRQRLSDEGTRLMESINRNRLAAGEIRVEHTEDEGDLAIISHDRELLLTLQESDFTWLKSVREAVERIDNGTYGECLICEEDIHEKRLTALPWVAFCVRCQEQMETDHATSLHMIATAEPEAPEF